MLQLNHKIFGEGKPLIILHGLFGSLDNWLTHAKNFSKKRQVILLDQRNHGRSPHTEEMNYDALAFDLKDFIEQQKLEKPDILGHSMGGKTAMQFACFFPSLFDKIIVADIAPRAYPVHHGLIIKGLQSINLQKIGSRTEAEEQFAAFAPEESTRQFLLKNLYRTDEGYFAWRFNLNSISTHIERLGEATHFTIPVDNEALFLRGSASDYVQEADIERIKEIFPNVHIHQIAGAGHWLHADKPLEFSDLVLNFLDPK
jgi:pimeloyl-ACP methyl ester carboxylesterase